MQQELCICPGPTGPMDMPARPLLQEALLAADFQPIPTTPAAQPTPGQWQDSTQGTDGDREAQEGAPGLAGTEQVGKPLPQT